jgi:glycosyltransferase involved in cell wall biosynthesis
MKILMIASLYRPYARGGAETVFNSIVDELKKYHTVSVISIVPAKGIWFLIPRVAKEDGVFVYRFCPLNVFSFVNIAGKPALVRLLWHVIDMFNIHSFFAVRSVIRKERPDVVMTHNLKGLGSTIPLAIRSCAIPHIHTVHDLQLIYPSGTLLFGEESSYKNTARAVGWYAALQRMLFGSPTCVVFASHFLRAYHTRRGFFAQSQIIELANPIFPPPHGCQEGRSALRKTPCVFSFLGQLEKHKGILFLVDTFKKWKCDSARLIIGGRGSVSEEVLREIANDSRIEYRGFIDDCPAFLRAVDYMIVPSLCYENAPMITSESLLFGIPVIVSRIGGAVEPIRDGVNGFIFIPGDEQSLIEIFERALSVSLERYEELSLNARASVSGYFTERYCARLLDCLHARSNHAS